LQGLELDLSGNHFICSCDNLEFLQWIQSSPSITFHYAGNHVCTDSPGNTIHNIEVDAMHCNWYWVQPLIAVGSTLAVSLAVLSAVLMYKKRWAVRNLIFRLQERLCLKSDASTGGPFKYDAFVVYSSTDDDRLWVHYKLVQELENLYGFRLCIHHRDFLAGCDIVDNIDNAIQSSRKVLVIMSEHCLRSKWCKEEVQMTKSLDPRKFIMIMYKDVMLSGVSIPLVFRNLLEKTYIEWGESRQEQELFWKKLKRAMYTKQQLSTEEPPHVWNVSDSLMQQSSEM
jgi:hypothetical protein